MVIESLENSATNGTDKFEGNTALWCVVESCLVRVVLYAVFKVFKNCTITFRIFIKHFALVMAVKMYSAHSRLTPVAFVAVLRSKRLLVLVACLYLCLLCLFVFLTPCKIKMAANLSRYRTLRFRRRIHRTHFFYFYLIYSFFTYFILVFSFFTLFMLSFTDVKTVGIRGVVTKREFWPVRSTLGYDHLSNIWRHRTDPTRLRLW